MNILIGSSEVQPFSKTGGLADMVAALGKFLGRAGVRVRLVTPLYRGLIERHPEIRQTDRVVRVSIGGREEKAAIYEWEASENYTIEFIDHVHYFQRSGIYGERNEDYSDNAERFLFLTRVLLALSLESDWTPDLVHIHDWPLGLYPVLLRDVVARGKARRVPKTLCTIHNLAYQGIFPPDELALTGLDASYFTPSGIEYYGKLNFLKAGIVYADHVSTVSPAYADEILTSEYGCGLEGVLVGRERSLSGILNGVDYTEWNTTSSNPHLKFAYTANRPGGKMREKKRLQHDLGLPVEGRVPLFGMISRLVEQKGVALLGEALEQALNHRIQFVCLGSGDPELEAVLQTLEQRFPDRVRVKIGYDVMLSHRIEAGSDFYLMPSRFEPCGLNQMYSLRYGTIPIVHAAGGLRDSVVDSNEDNARATGIKFEAFNSAALLEAIYRARRIYKRVELFRAYRTRGMAADFSWERTAKAYLDLYRRVLEEGAAANP